ncbi:MAG: peptide chain release factor N(5)-glutamine methyltransferase [Acidimicrobiales bacterium]|nr:peptide chain release factor N(5)-glutamine methyltransferase [Acidimicrobiales bacterium]
MADGGSPDGTVTWSELLAETVERLSAAGFEGAAREARWIVEEASGLEGAEWVLGCGDPATQRTVAHLDAMVGRRLAGEPIQYVLGHWAFRDLDLLCDRRTLIPRPETEQVVDAALAELDRVLLARHGGHRPVVVDLGTGTGAIALSIATERHGSDVWAVDSSEDALAVARANTGGLGMAGARVRLLAGSWFEPLPEDLRGAVDLVVTNPPYIAADEDLDPSVGDWEPESALVAGPTGLECYEEILAEAAEWLAEDGVIVAEIGAAQGDSVAELAQRSGYGDVEVLRDHADLDRILVARRQRLNASTIR